ncbi:MAG: zinc-binding dehydrogenase [Elusimicrobiota bacterium]|jgi:L-iditol 2-dehydrogenase
MTAPARMQAVIFRGPKSIHLEEVPVPKPGPGEVLLKVGAALTCGTDFKAYRQGHKVLLGDGPAPFGHEFAGTVVAVGLGVTGVRPGQRVVAANSAPCEGCFFCAKGQPQLCEDLKLHNGGYAQYNLVPAHIVRHNLHPLADSVDFKTAALSEPLACALHAVDVMGVRGGENAAILGSGIMSMLLTGALKARGARVLVVGRTPAKLERALEAGADRVASSLKTDPVAAARDFAGGHGPDCVFEAVGSAETWTTAVSMVRIGGRVCLYGGCAQGTKVPIDAHRIHYGQISLHGVFHHTPKHFRQALDLLTERKVDSRRFIASEIRLDEVPSYFAKMHAQSPLKVAVFPGVS